MQAFQGAGSREDVRRYDWFGETEMAGHSQYSIFHFRGRARALIAILIVRYGAMWHLERSNASARIVEIWAAVGQWYSVSFAAAAAAIMAWPLGTHSSDDIVSTLLTYNRHGPHVQSIKWWCCYEKSSRQRLSNDPFMTSTTLVDWGASEYEEDHS